MGDVTVTSGSEGRIESKLDALLVTTTRIETEITNRGKQIDDHEQRLRVHDTQLAELKATQGSAGRFTWGDVFRAVSALAAAGSILALLAALARATP